MFAPPQSASVSPSAINVRHRSLAYIRRVSASMINGGSCSGGPMRVRGRGDMRLSLAQIGRMWPPNRSSHMAKKLPPVHPGEILREEFLVPLKLTPYAVAAALKVPRTRIERIAREEKPVTADTALRLGKFFKTGAAFWMNIQARFDLETAEDVLAPQIKKIASYEAA